MQNLHQDNYCWQYEAQIEHAQSVNRTTPEQEAAQFTKLPTLGDSDLPRSYTVISQEPGTSILSSAALELRRGRGRGG